MSRASHQTSQNVDNHISERSSTRRHAPPGGSSTMGSLIFGGGDASDEPVRRSGVRRDIQQNTPLKAPYGETPEKAYEPAKETHSAYSSNNNQKNADIAGRVSSNSYASGASQNNGNVLTDRRTTRVRAPPGGQSSFSLG